MADFKWLWNPRGRDSLKNGTVLGALFGLSIAYGDSVKEFIIGLIPESLTDFAGSLSIPIILIGLGIIVGYYIDRK